MKKAREVKKKSWLRRWGRLGILLGIKESYLFFRNTLGLGIHPVKTLRAMQREKDRSQQLLVLGLPVYMVVGGVAVVVGGRWLIGAPEEWGGLARGVIVGVGLVGLSLAGYLAYWLIRVEKMRGDYD